LANRISIPASHSYYAKGNRKVPDCLYENCVSKTVKWSLGHLLLVPHPKAERV
jgi:hypothetical protein